MASKSKKRRRVLGASCILAALIIAGSSFAWFTSKDEVTNRLSANADYDVSIVESFTPPQNFLPGMEVNKDVYGLNTGSIGAFLNADVTSKLTYTVENTVTAWSNDCVTLDADEVDAKKAGAFLAGAFDADGKALVTNTAADGEQPVYVADPELGNIAVYFNNGPGTDPKTTDDFTPTATGYYFFRRSIAVSKNEATGDVVKTFEYAGYYFDATSGNYYKLADMKTNEGTASEDGTLTVCPTVLFAKEKTETVTPNLVYDDTNKRLIASYNTKGETTPVNGSAIDSADQDVTGPGGALADLNEAKATLEEKQAAYEAADSKYQTALTGIAYYAGSENAKTIKGKIKYNTQRAPMLFTNGQSRSYQNQCSEVTIQGNGGPLSSIVAPGIMRTHIDDYNTLVGQWNELTSEYISADQLVTSKTSAKNTAETEYNDAVEAFTDAKEAYNAELGQDFDADIAAIGTPANTTEIYQVWELEQEMNEKKAALDTAVAELAAAEAAKTSAIARMDAIAEKANALYLTIQEETGHGSNPAIGTLNYYIQMRDDNDPAADGSASSEYEDAKEAFEQALANYTDKLKAYNDLRAAYDVADASENDLVFYIKLSDDVVTSTTEADKWQILPINVADGTAHFYYTGILDGGETTAKLIDSVELDKDTSQKAYKNFDFDLNIVLDSAQISYADDNKTIVSASVTDNAAFEGRTANLTDPTSVDTPVLWS